jgi:23S rRNA pseudouridine1911/1915/1917 synthase
MEARRALERGGVYLDGRRCKVASRALLPGQRVEAVLEEAGRVQEPATPPLVVLHEDDQLLAVDKAAGVPSQAALSGDVGTLPWLVGRHLGVPASAVATVHRLDRETSGVVVFGKTRGATRLLAEAFREGGVRKEYVAVVAGRLADEGRIDAPLGPSKTRRGSFEVTPGGTPAITGFRVFGRQGDLAAGVRLFPETGRTHQLRVHLASLGHPILGDVRYGGPREAGTIRADRVLLHAEVLDLPHPNGGRLRLEAPPPADLAAAVALLA